MPVVPEDSFFAGESRKEHDRLRRNAQQQEENPRSILFCPRLSFAEMTSVKTDKKS
jgi:hypothetical protein